MPRTPSRCPKKGCRLFKPCPKHPDGWAANKSRPLPSNWTALKKAVIRRDGAVCRRCGITRDLELDHRISRARGGTDDLSNLQLLCHRCHQLKTWEEKKKPRH